MTVTINLPSELAANAKTLARMRGEEFSDFIAAEIRKLLNAQIERQLISKGVKSAVHGHLKRKSDGEVMAMANLRMEKWQAQQMHRLIHLAGKRALTEGEEKLLNTLLEIHNEVGIKKADAINEAIRRRLLPPHDDRYWKVPNRRKLSPQSQRR